MMKTLIVIPAYNEELNIERVVDNLIHNFPQYDYVVINDGSRDKTAAICKKKGYNFIDLPVNIGLSGAVQTGMRYAMEKGYDAVLQFDGDGQHRPEYIHVMEEKMLETNADIVIGSRFYHAKKNRSLRMFGNSLISMIIKITTGQTITDPTSGMRLFNKSVLREFADNINYGPEPDTISYLIKQGASVLEIKVEMDERIAGESYLNLKASMKYMILMCFSIIYVQQFRKGGAKK